MEEQVAGFTVTGTWDEVVEHGERVSAALEAAGVDPDDDEFQQWDEWRPKLNERLNADVNEKTAEQVAVNEGRGERRGKTPDEDLQKAGGKASESITAAVSGDPQESAGLWQDALSYLARAADSTSRKALRRIEVFLYKHVMTRISPYYFDNALVSANISQSTTRTPVPGAQAPRKEFILQVNITDDDLKSDVSNHLRDFEDKLKRWHLESEPETAHVEQFEGASSTTNWSRTRSARTRDIAAEKSFPTDVVNPLDGLLRTSVDDTDQHLFDPYQSEIQDDED